VVANDVISSIAADILNMEKRSSSGVSVIVNALNAFFGFIRVVLKQTGVAFEFAWKFVTAIALEIMALVKKLDVLGGAFSRLARLMPEGLSSGDGFNQMNPFGDTVDQLKDNVNEYLDLFGPNGALNDRQNEFSTNIKEFMDKMLNFQLKMPEGLKKPQEFGKELRQSIDKLTGAMAKGSQSALAVIAAAQMRRMTGLKGGEAPAMVGEQAMRPAVAEATRQAQIEAEARKQTELLRQAVELLGRDRVEGALNLLAPVRLI